MTAPVGIGLWKFKPRQLCAVIVALGLAIIPFVYMTSIVATTGANNISNDDIVEVGMIDQMLSGTYHWQNYFHDTFIRSHCFAFPFLIRLGVIVFTHWNVYTELYVGIAATLLKLLLLFDAFIHLCRRLSGLLLLPILSALAFSTSQINVFTFADAGLQIQFNQVGLALGIWSLVRFRPHWYAAAIMGLGGIIATWSGGGGLPVWPAFLVGLILLGYRKLSHYVFLCCAGAIAFLPYLFYEVLAQRNSGSDHVTSLLDLLLIRQAIGLPFSQGFSLHFAEVVGSIGILLCAVGLALLTTVRDSSVLTRAAPALMVLIYSSINIWLATSVRATLAPWYTTHFMLFWVGLIGLAYVLWIERSPIGDTATMLGRIRSLHLAQLWSAGLVILLGVLYAHTNITYADKVMYLYSRSPASASCIRNYRIAPTYCEGTVFQWGIGHPTLLPELAAPLERHHLTVFSPDEEWTLQGDYVLDNVHIQRVPGDLGPEWTQDLSGTPAVFSDYHHLNLLLRTPESISWKVSLPSTLKHADFHSAIAISTATPPAATARSVRFQVYVSTDHASRLAFHQDIATSEHDWQPFSIPLSAYAGKTITLRLTSNGRDNLTADWAMYRYPTIGISLDPRAPVDPEAGSKRFVAKPTPNDARFSVAQAIQGVAPTNLCLGNYGYLFIRMSAATQIQPRVVRVTYLVGGLPQPIDIPLFADGAMHDYSYDLKLLPLQQGTHITGLGITPAYGATMTGSTHISDLRLIRGPTVCS